MDSKEAKEWFGVAPPDLTVAARARSSAAGSGADWIIPYLRASIAIRASDRLEQSRLRDVAMPHVLWQLNGQPQLLKKISRRSTPPRLR